MPRSNLFLSLAGIAALVIFIYGLIHILLLRYERGDLYASYSTLRTDPLGARVFYEALNDTGRYQATRGYFSVHREVKENPGTLFFIALDPSELSSFTEDEVTALNDYVQNGGRVVITFPPVGAGTEFSSTPKTKPDDGDDKDKEDAPDKSSSDSPSEVPVAGKTEQERFEREAFRKNQEADKNLSKNEIPDKYKLSLEALWGFGWDRHGLNDKIDKDEASRTDAGASGDVAVQASNNGAETEVPWKTARYLVRIERDWKVDYRAQGQPVLIQRPWGNGEIVISADSYFLSNEALRDGRRSRLLSLMAGPRRQVLFDEAHLGTQESEGIMALARRFGLEGYLCGMLVVAALFLWRNSVPLVPPRPVPPQSLLGGAVSGKDSRSGLVNLLRRNIGEQDILKACLSEWKRAVHPGRQHLYPKVAEMESLLANTQPNGAEQIVGIYHQLREINKNSRTQENYAAKS